MFWRTTTTCRLYKDNVRVKCQCLHQISQYVLKVFYFLVFFFCFFTLIFQDLWYLVIIIIMFNFYPNGSLLKCIPIFIYLFFLRLTKRQFHVTTIGHSAGSTMWIWLHSLAALSRLDGSSVQPCLTVHFTPTAFSYYLFWLLCLSFFSSHFSFISLTIHATISFLSLCGFLFLLLTTSRKGGNLHVKLEIGQ